MNDKLELRAVSAPWYGGVELLVKQGDAFGTNIILEKKDEGLVIEPTMRIDNDQAQILMDG